MSHFLTIVLVKPDLVAGFKKEDVPVRISKIAEEMLSPFQENNMGDCPRQYMKFEDIEDEYRDKYERASWEAVKMEDGSYVSQFDNRFMDPEKFGERKIPDHLQIVNVPFKERYSTFDEYMVQHFGHSKDADKGRYGYWENPEARWDWYVIGGRWDGVFMPEGYEPRDQYEHNIDSNVVLVKDLPPGTTCFAFLTPAGEWIERGSMGWWAVVSGEIPDEEWEKQCKTILERHSDCYAVAVDCHI